MDWVEDEAVLELVRAEALHRVPDRVLDLALAQDEAPADPVVVVLVVAEERLQQPWAHRTRSVREVKRRR